MITYILKRAAYSCVVLLALLIVIFLISTAIGDPTRIIVGPEAPESVYLALRHQLGFDDPLYVQFFRAVGTWFRGDFGISLSQHTPALPTAIDRVPATLVLAAVTMLIAVPTAVGLGVLSATRPGSWADKTLTTLSLMGVSVADFWLGMMLIIVFAIRLQWLPTSGFSGWQYIVLPAITLAARPIGRLAQVTRATLLEQMQQQYPLTARAKGVSEGGVVLRHALPNAAVGIVTVIGVEVVAIFSGAVVVETLFAWPGIGNLLIDAIRQRDLPLIQATTVVVAVLVIIANLVVDVSLGLIDRRVRED